MKENCIFIMIRTCKENLFFIEALFLDFITMKLYLLSMIFFTLAVYACSLATYLQNASMQTSSETILTLNEKEKENEL